MVNKKQNAEICSMKMEEAYLKREKDKQEEEGVRMVMRSEGGRDIMNLVIKYNTCTIVNKGN